MSLAVRRHHRRHRGSEDGYVLLAVLAMLSVCTILILGLLTMAMVDLKVQRMSQRSGAVSRAIDGALEAATNAVKTSSGGFTGRAGNACDPVPQLVLEGTTVDILCTPLPGPRSEVLPTTEGPAVTLVGAYTTPIDDIGATIGAYTSASIIGQIAAWLSGLVAILQNQIEAAGPGLIYVGPQPLRIDGDLRVREWTLAQRRIGGTGVSPAIQVNGRFRQGDLGLLGGIGFWFFGTWIGTPFCGILDPAFPGDIGTDIDATLGRTCGLGPGHVDFANTSTPVATWGSAEKSAAAQTVPATCSTWQAAGNPNVVVVPPGYYSYNQMTKLNAWFSGACRNVTFHFPPGDYYFDVAGGAGFTRGAVRFADVTNRWVFGTPHGWDPSVEGAPAPAFPAACDPTQAGVTITLSSRTTIQHADGLAAACGTTDGTGARRLLYQEVGTGTATWATTPADATSGVWWPSTCSTGSPDSATFVNPGDGAGSTTKPVDLIDYPAEGSPWDESEAPTELLTTASCSVSGSNFPSLTYSGFHAPFSGSISNVKIRVKGTSSNIRFAQVGNQYWCGFLTLCHASTMQGELVTGDGVHCALAESTALPAGTSTASMVRTYTLANPTCLVDGAQFEGATLTLKPWLVRSNGALAASLSIDHAWIEATTSNTTPPSALWTLVHPDAGRGMWLFGQTMLPNGGVNVNWQGSASDLP
ncbi:MAG: hypothetical protein IT195_09605, partial [Microthrixaceae bacterium]|nr:hypothetical protein [Microthrixaceae bacterium]